MWVHLTTQRGNRLGLHSTDVAKFASPHGDGSVGEVICPRVARCTERLRLAVRTAYPVHRYATDMKRHIAGTALRLPPGVGMITLVAAACAAGSRATPTLTPVAPWATLVGTSGIQRFSERWISFTEWSPRCALDMTRSKCHRTPEHGSSRVVIPRQES
jgi:hypothetical protein